MKHLSSYTYGNSDAHPCEHHFLHCVVVKYNKLILKVKSVYSLINKCRNTVECKIKRFLKYNINPWTA